MKHITLRAWISFGLMIASIMVLAGGVAGQIRGASEALLMAFSLTAAALGWGLGQSKLNGWQAAGRILLFGGILLWSVSARYDGPLLRLFFSIFSQTEPPIQALQGFADQTLALWTRAQGWLDAVAGNAVVISDPVMNGLAWGAVLWLICAWLGWAQARKSALGGLAPALALLAGLADYTGQGTEAVLGLLGLGLAQMGVARYRAGVGRWQARGMDYADLITYFSIVSVVIISFVLVGLAWLGSVLPFRDFADAFRPHISGQESLSALSLGLNQEGSPYGVYRDPSLPQQKLLGSGPQLNQNLIFRVRTGELPAIPVSGQAVSAPRHYWKARSYDEYNGLGWASSGLATRKYDPNQPVFDLIPPGFRLLRQEFSITRWDDRTLYWAGAFSRSDSAFEAAWRLPPGLSRPDALIPFNEADAFGGVITSPSYVVESYLPNYTVQQLQSAGEDYPAWVREHYLQLPSQLPERVRALAAEVTAGAETPYEKASAIESYLRENYPYTLDIPAPPAATDVADYFLFDLKKGYCDYYATAMAVMARSVGVPARLVSGYASGTYDVRNAEYNVTAADAHSWVEVYFPGVGWVEFEPTAAQQEIIRPDQPAATQDTPQPGNSAIAVLEETLKNLPPVTRWGLLPLLGVGLFALVCWLLEAFALLILPARHALRWMMRDIYHLGQPLGGEPVPGRTIREFVSTVEAKLGSSRDLRLLAVTYEQALFTPAQVTRAQVRAALSAWRKLRWRLLWTRLRSRG
jgi:hypothetical protein